MATKLRLVDFGGSRQQVKRFFYIDRAINSGTYPNCTTLGKELEVDRNTILDDIKCLIEHLNMPIEYDGVERGYYYTRPASLSGLKYTPRAIRGLLAIQKMIVVYKGTEMERDLRELSNDLKKMYGHGPAKALEAYERRVSFHVLGPDKINPKTHAKVDTGVHELRKLMLSYRKRGDRKTIRRKFHPWAVLQFPGRVYVIGFDELRGQGRTFQLSRMSHVKLTDEKFELPKGFSIKKWLGDTFDVWHGPGNIKVRIRFEWPATDQLMNRIWPRKWKFIAYKNGRSEMRMTVNNLEEVAAFVRSFGQHAKVIGPPELVEMVAEDVHATAALYPNWRKKKPAKM